VQLEVDDGSSGPVAGLTVQETPVPSFWMKEESSAMGIEPKCKSRGGEIGWHRNVYQP